MNNFFTVSVAFCALVLLLLPSTSVEGRDSRNLSPTPRKCSRFETEVFTDLDGGMGCRVAGAVCGGARRADYDKAMEQIRNGDQDQRRFPVLSGICKVTNIVEDNTKGDSDGGSGRERSPMFSRTPPKSAFVCCGQSVLLTSEMLDNKNNNRD